MEAQLRQTPADLAVVQRFEEAFHCGRFLASIHEDGSLTLSQSPTTAPSSTHPIPESLAQVMREMVHAVQLPE